MSVLFSDFTQDTRLLKLTTPLGSDKLIVECLRAEEGVSQGYLIKLTVLSTDAAIASKSLLGQPALVELLTATSRDRPRPFHGHITSVACLDADGGLARYALTIEPWYAFLAHGRDSRIFQNKTVVEILEAIFGGWQSLGRLVPAWRFDILDPSVYPKRSVTTQYQESNLAFAERLMHEEGLFHYFEHEGDTGSDTLGKHTMVIADHNGSFQPNSQASIRFTQPGAVMKEDSIDRWRTEMRWLTDAVQISSWDYRALSDRPVGATGTGADGRELLTSVDAPGTYAYQSRTQGQRIADNQVQALDAARESHIGAGTVRTLAPGTTFALEGQSLLDLAEHDDARNFTILRVIHLAHNNLSTDAREQAAKLLGRSPLELAIDEERQGSLHATGAAKGERPLYRNRIDAIRSSVPYRSATADGHGVVLHPRPTIRGQQTAIVVGPADATIHTDRDHRIKVQFHWQRGEQSHSRLNHPAPAGTGAPANDEAGTWVRVATPMAPIAGANRGAHAIPRVGSEVLIDFIDGNIDRPVVIGSIYNGKGQTDAQSNGVAQGAGVATGNAPAWFPGNAGAHAHPATLSGFKTQAMASSQSGGGAYSQLVFDDSVGQARVALQRHASAHRGTDELNLGHLVQQTDNQRLKPAGFGAELKTEHSVALRAAQGMLISSNGRREAMGFQLDSREAQVQIEASHQLAVSMADTAQKHNAALKDSDGKAEPEAEKLPALEAAKKSIEVVEATGKGGGGPDGFGGGQGEVTAYSESQIQLSSPAGIVAATPANAFLVAGATCGISAGHDINSAAQGNLLHAVKGGISLFTYGKASSSDKPNQETGIRLHAALGKVGCESQSGETRITADKAVTVASVTKSVSIMGSDHVLMTAQGAFIKLEGGNIMIHGPGKMEFKASSKELAGPSSATAELPKKAVGKLAECPAKQAAAGAGGASAI